MAHETPTAVSIKCYWHAATPRHLRRCPRLPSARAELGHCSRGPAAGKAESLQHLALYKNVCDPSVKPPSLSLSPVLGNWGLLLVALPPGTVGTSRKCPERAASPGGPPGSKGTRVLLQDRGGHNGKAETLHPRDFGTKSLSPPHKSRVTKSCVTAISRSKQLMGQLLASKIRIAKTA